MAKALALRAFHLDLKWQHYRFDRYLGLLDDLAEWGYNAVVLEYENMFPYRSCPTAVHRDAWTMKQIRQFVERARTRKIQVIPLMQCFGHLEFVLRLPKYRHLAENPKTPSELCPCKDGAAELVHAMIDEIVQAHPESQYIHIGGDEVWSLGTCPQCKRKVGRLGKSRIYIDFVSPFVERVLAAGKRPILWGDMLLNHPEALDALSRDTVLCDWQYWPEGTIEPQIVDWTSGTWVNPLTLPVVKPDTLGRFRSHWAVKGGKEWPVRFKGWPYTEYLRKAGFDVILGSSIRSGGDNYSSARYPMHLRNSLSAVEAATASNSLGVVVTSWAIRRAPLENQMLGMAVVGKAMHKPGNFNMHSATDIYERKRFGGPLDLLDAYSELGAMVHCLNMTNYGKYDYSQHRVNPPLLEEEIARVGGAPGRTPLLMRETANNGMHAADDILSWLASEKPKGREIDVLRFCAEEVRYKAWLVYAVCEHLRGKKLKPAQILKEIRRLKGLLRKTFEGFWTEWTIRDELRFRYGPDEAWVKGLR